MNRATISKIYIYYTGVESVTRLSFLFLLFFSLLHRKVYIFTKVEEGGREREGYMKKLFLSDAFHHRRDVRRTTSIHWDSGVRAMDVSHCRTNPDYKFQPRCCNLWIRLTDWSTDCRNHLITINIFTLRIRRPGTNTVDSRRSFDSRSNHLLKILWQRLFVSLITTILDNTFILYPSFPVLSSIVSPMLSNLSLFLSLSLSLFLRNISIASFVPFVS